MKRRLYGVLAVGASILVTTGVLAPTAQAEPDINVTCNYTVRYDGIDIFAVDCTGAPVGTNDRGWLTLADRHEKFECERIIIMPGRGSDELSALGFGCESND